MAIKAPTTDQIVQVGAQLGMSLSEDETTQYLAAMQPMLAGYGVVDSMADELPEVRYPRVPGHRPTGEENPTTAGTGRPRSRARPRASSPASGSRSRTMSASPACR